MITDCPACRRQFRVYAWQLSAAGGLVQCGYCGERYNALERLHDQPLPATPALPSSAADHSSPGVVDEPQFYIPGSQQASAPVYDEVTAEEYTTPGVPVADGDLKAGMQEQTGDDEGDEIPPELLIPERPAPPLWGRLLWGLGILLLITMVIVQLAWFNRDRLLERYPEYRPLVKSLCERYGCETVREYDLDAIVLLNRDVRDHPRYSDTLLVNATVENQSDHVQPYPRIRLILYDTGGNISGYRIFNPELYLENGVDIEAGMPVRVPVHIVLELTGATEAAVSFEFDFIKY